MVDVEVMKKGGGDNESTKVRPEVTAGSGLSRHDRQKRRETKEAEQADASAGGNSGPVRCGFGGGPELAPSILVAPLEQTKTRARMGENGS